MGVRALRSQWPLWIEKARRVDAAYGREAAFRYLLEGKLETFVLRGSEDEDYLDAVEDFAAAIRRAFPREEIRAWFSREIEEATEQGVRGNEEGSPSFLRFLMEMYFPAE